MPRIYWLIALTIIGLILPIPNLHKIPNDQGIVVGNSTIEIGGQNYKDHNSVIYKQSKLPAVPIEQQHQTLAGKSTTQGAEQREIAVLEAQQSMAESSIRLLELTKRQLCIGAVSAFMVFAALIFTAKSTRAATEAAKTAAEQHRTAVAGMSRPYIFIESVQHNLEEWQEGKAELRFIFRFKNYGSAPANVKSIRTITKFSGSPTRNVTQADKDLTVVVEDFPDPDDFMRIINPPSYVAAEHLSQVMNDDVVVCLFLPETGNLILEAGSTTEYYTQNVFWVADVSEQGARWRLYQHLRDRTSETNPIWAWLFGKVTYETAFGTSHYTNFCVRAIRGGKTAELNYKPYTERT